MLTEFPEFAKSSTHGMSTHGNPISHAKAAVPLSLAFFSRPGIQQLLELACERTCECAAGFTGKEYW